MNEAELQSAVIDLAHLLKWRVAHFRPAMNAKGEWRTAVAADGKGFPDLVLVRRGELIFAELKSESGKLSPEQVEWMEDLRYVAEGSGGMEGLSHAVAAFVWKPEDWANGAIEDTLRMGLI